MLQELGTIAFDFAHMRALIGNGGIVQDQDGRIRIEKDLDPTTVQFGLWLATVPEVYRPLAELKAREVGERWLCRAKLPHDLNDIVGELASECVRAIREHIACGGRPALPDDEHERRRVFHEHMALTKPARDAEWREQQARSVAELRSRLPAMTPEELLENWERRSHGGALEEEAILRAEILRLVQRGKS